MSSNTNSYDYGESRGSVSLGWGCQLDWAGEVAMGPSSNPTHPPAQGRRQ